MRRTMPSARRGCVRVIGALGVAVALVVGSAPLAGAACGGGRASAAELRAVEQRLLASANTERGALGAPRLSTHDELTALAREHAARMARDGRIYHSEDLFASVGSLGAGVLGENVGTGCSADQLHAAFMSSPEHRANVVDGRFTRVGMAAASNDDGVLYVVQAFGAFPEPEPATPPPPPPSPPPSPAPAPEPAAAGTSFEPAAPQVTPGPPEPAGSPDPAPATPQPPRESSGTQEPTGYQALAPEQRRSLAGGDLDASPAPVSAAREGAAEPVAGREPLPLATAVLAMAAAGSLLSARRRAG